VPLANKFLDFIGVSKIFKKGFTGCLPVVGGAVVGFVATLQTIILLTISNVFMTFAWYAHLRDLREKPWIIAALVSWGIAFFEYLVQVPANRIGHQVMNLGQLKILQEVITLSVFVPFAVFFMKEKLTWNYLGAAACLAGAVFFIFRK
jgi:uncharacterized protein (DUF486 family)